MILIRKTKDSDAEQFSRLIILVWKHAYAHIFPAEVFEQREKSIDERIAKFKERRVNKSDNNIGFVAVENGKIVALASGSTLSRYEYYKNLGYADLEAIYIHPDYQHKGLGKKLFDKFVKTITAKGCTKMVIGVLKENHKARSAYEKWGGKLDGYEQQFIVMEKSYPEVFYLFNI